MDLTDTRAGIAEVIESFIFSAAIRADAESAFLVRKGAALRVSVLVAESASGQHDEQSEQQRIAKWVEMLFSKVEVEPLRSLLTAALDSATAMSHGSTTPVATTVAALLLLSMTISTFPASSASGPGYVKGLSVVESSRLRAAMATVIPAIQAYLTSLIGQFREFVLQSSRTTHAASFMEILRCMLGKLM